jgi:arylsulfatase A-like enzyme
LVVLLCALGLSIAAPAAHAQPEDPPNILFAFADDWGTHAGVYGTVGLETPIFDRVAEQGVLFERAFVSSPSCTPSRGAVLTGQHIWRLGPGANLWSTLPAELPVYPHMLQEDAGYFVGHTRKGWGPGRLEPGGRDARPAGPSFESFDAFLDARPADAPFVFWFGSSDPHRVYADSLRAAMNLDPADVTVPPYYPDVPAVRRDIANYYAEVQRFDQEVGQLMDRLRAMGELDNTIVVISGDHGWPFPRGKTQLYDAGTHVPLAIQWPDRVPPGRVVQDFVSLTDLAPTFLEAADVAVPEQMTGRSLLPLLASDRDRFDAPRDEIVFGRERHTPAQAGDESGGYPMRAIRTDEFLYIRNFTPDRWPSGTPDWQNAYLEEGWLGDCDNGPAKFYLWAHRDDPDVAPLYDLSFAKRPAEELYVLQDDPHQMRNVADDPDHAATKTRLRERLMEALAATDDPRAADAMVPLDEGPYYGGIPNWPGQETIDAYE